jgi:hypothetical protein
LCVARMPGEDNNLIILSKHDDLCKHYTPPPNLIAPNDQIALLPCSSPVACVCFWLVVVFELPVGGHIRQLSWKCCRHVATCLHDTNMSLQFWPDGSMSPTQF